MAASKNLTPGQRQTRSRQASYESWARTEDRTKRTAVTRMLDSGTTVSATAKWLGHDPAMALRVYGHVYDDALASAGDALLGRSRADGTQS